MTIYLLLIVFILVTSFIQKQHKKIYLMFCLFFIWIIIALRSYFIGNDTITYVTIFPLLANFPLSAYGNNLISVLFTENRFEYGYVLFNKIIYYFSKNPRWLLIISATIIVSLVGYILYKYSDNPSLSLIIFVTMGFMAGSMSQIRQYIAWSICLFSIKYIMENKFIRFILTIMLAMLFHVSAIVFIPLYFISKIRFTLSKGVKLAILCSPIFIFFNYFSNLVGKIIKSYGNYDNKIANNGSTGYLAITVNFVTIFLFLMLSMYLIHINKKYNQFNSNLVNLSLWMLFCALMITALSYKFSQFTRIVSYFTCALMILIPNQLSFGKNDAMKKIITFIFVIYLILNFVIVHIIRPGWGSITPYHFMTSWWGY